MEWGIISGALVLACASLLLLFSGEQQLLRGREKKTQDFASEMGNLKEKVDKKQQKKSKKGNNSKFSEKDAMIKKEDERNKVNKPAEKKKRKREKGNTFDGGDAIQISREDDRTKAEGERKRNKLRKKKQRSEEQNNALVGKYDQLGSESEDGFNEQKCKSKKSKKKKKEHDNTSKEEENILEKRGETDHGEAYCISSVDEDCSKGMKKWLTDYHQSRPGLKVLQQRLDEFIISHEEKLEQERKEREDQAAEGGWTVVKHHKGRKKTTDSESGITVGSVAPAAVENQMTKKKPKEVGLEFYRFQKREAQRSEIMALRSKFEEDRKRIQQLRAARKFRPY